MAACRKPCLSQTPRPYATGISYVANAPSLCDMLTQQAAEFFAARQEIVVGA